MPPAPLQLHACDHFRDMPTHHTVRSQAPDYLLIWVLGGRGFGRSTCPKLPAQAGDLFVFEKGAPHEYGAYPSDPWDILWVHCDGPAAVDFVSRIRKHAGLRSRLGFDTRIHDRFQELILAYAAGTPQARRLCDCLLWGLLGLIVHRLEMRTQLSVPANLYDLYRVQAYIQEHLAASIRLDDLARTANVSVRQLGRLFQQAFHVSPMQYVIHQRMDKAGLLLNETNLPLKQIAIAVGCHDAYYFSRLFHKTTGISPKAYRQGRAK